MAGIDWVLEVVLVGLLGMTLVHAIRLERALGVLRRDRTALGDALAGFDTSTRQAEAGLGKLQAMAGEAAQQVARRVEHAAALKDDLAFLSARGEQLADRLDALVRAARALDAPPAAAAELRPTAATPEPAAKVRSQAERNLLQALRGGQ